MFHAAPRTGGGIAAQKQRHFAQLLRGDKLPGGLLFRQQLRAGLLRVDPSAMRLSICCCTSGVSTQPGQMALQVMPLRAVSRATVLVSPTTACLAAT